MTTLDWNNIGDYNLSFNVTENEIINNTILDASTWKIDAYLLARLLEIEQSYIEKGTQESDKLNLLGDFGEEYAFYNLNQKLNLCGFHYSKTIEPNAYYMIPQYRRNKDGAGGQGGIDIYVRITDGEGVTLSCMVEVSNWRKYDYLSDDTYKKKILNKFTEYDRLDRSYHVEAIPMHNIPIIKDRCQRDGIYILPIKVHITPEYLHFKYKSHVERLELRKKSINRREEDESLREDTI